jgi:Holliday junction resolvase RusA-like endonuclease
MPEPTCRFTCPIGPSVNNLFVNTPGRGRIRGTPYRDWLHDAGWIVKLQHPPAVPGLVRVFIEAPLHRRRDLDNSLKAPIDLIVQLGIIKKDNLIDDLRIVRCGEGDSMTVSLWPL